MGEQLPLFGRYRGSISADALLHRIRWEVAVNTTGDDFKINNDFAALYARKFREQYPEHAGFFETRERRAA